MSHATTARWRQMTEKALDILLPPLCLACDAPVGTNKTLCPQCWGQIHFITPPLCKACGAPFDVPVGEGMLCAGCVTEMPDFASARAAMLYNDASKRLILGFKHSDRTHPAAALASWMQRAAETLLVEADFIIPVPLHRWRLFKRRYNQSALLALELGKLSGKRVLADGLLRLRPTPTQGHLSRKERQTNVKGAFGLNPRYAAAVEGKNVVLVDDVLTTGATVNECSRVLLKAGAGSVSVLVLARVKGFI